MMDNLSALKHHVQAGRLHAYAVSSGTRTAHLQAVPTLKESGIEFEGESWFALFAPAATPAVIVAALRSTVADVLGDADFAARVEKDGGRVLAIAPREQGKFLQHEIERWGSLVARYGIGVD